MFRTLLPCLVAAVAPGLTQAQPKADPTKPFPVDPAVLRQIEAKTAELRAAVTKLPAATVDDLRADVEVYLKAAEWAVRHGEFLQKDTDRQVLRVLDAGLVRARAAAAGRTPWREVRGRPVARGYRSKVDGSVQPYRVTLPEGFGQGDKKWRLDVVLHGRDQTLTEVKFVAGKEAAGPAAKPAEAVVLEPYGRGNNAYRWAGEADVFEAVEAFLAAEAAGGNPAPIDESRVVLRGFSMGGAGTWHLGLHHPFHFTALGPGAGFTATRGYLRSLPAALPAHVEKSLRIYDAVGYAENVVNVPVVAYSGETDPQKAAADAIQEALAGFPEPVRVTHLVAPGLGHKQPPEWVAKVDDELRKLFRPARRMPERARFVTYTTRYHDFGHGHVEALDRLYDKAVVDSRWTADRLELTTVNVRALKLIAGRYPGQPAVPAEVVVDGQRLDLKRSAAGVPSVPLFKRDGRWAAAGGKGAFPDGLVKRLTSQPLQGPIDDAFRDPFVVVRPAGDGLHPAVTRHAAAAAARFAGEWDKFFRGWLPTKPAAAVPPEAAAPPVNLVLFGDPGSNPVIARVVERLPITWTADELVVAGVRYDPRTHVPVLIYPNPLDPSRYVVLNSGHTFRAADLRGSNALLYPRLGDWAVLKVAPTADDPAAAEVVAAGLFDEGWRFP